MQKKNGGPLRPAMSLPKWPESSFMSIALGFEKSFTKVLGGWFCSVWLDPAVPLQSLATLMV